MLRSDGFEYINWIRHERRGKSDSEYGAYDVASGVPELFDIVFFQEEWGDSHLSGQSNVEVGFHVKHHQCGIQGVFGYV